MARISLVTLLVVLIAAVAAQPTVRGPGRRAATTQPDASADTPRIASPRYSEVPITSPIIVDEPSKKTPPRLLAEGQLLLDLPGELTKDPTGKWWTIPHPRTGTLRLLPCPQLQALEDLHAAEPELEFLLSGLAYRYQEKYYLLLRKTQRVRPAPPAAPKPAAPTATRPATTTAPATQPVDQKDVSAEDVARRLLGDIRGKPVVPVAVPPVPETDVTSVPPARSALRPGPGRMIINRLIRLRRAATTDQWHRLAFDSDNTLREPPLRIMPNWQLEKIEPLPPASNQPEERFYISAEVYRYRGRNYVLLRSVRPRRDMDQF